MNRMSPYTTKFTLGSVTRVRTLIISHPVSGWEKLTKVVSDIFELKEDAKFVLVYKDSDGVEITFVRHSISYSVKRSVDNVTFWQEI